MAVNIEDMHTPCRHTMCCKVGYTANCVALDLHVGTQHLSDERLKTSKLDDE